MLQREGRLTVTSTSCIRLNSRNNVNPIPSIRGWSLFERMRPIMPAQLRTKGGTSFQPYPTQIPSGIRGTKRKQNEKEEDKQRGKRGRDERDCRGGDRSEGSGGSSSSNGSESNWSTTTDSSDSGSRRRGARKWL